jgi:hypothetical protein
MPILHMSLLIIMKNTLVLTTLLFCLVSGILNPHQASSNPVNPTNWKTLTQSNYSIQYPTDWNLEQSKDLGELPPSINYLFTILSPVESKDDQFRENVNLITENLNGKQIDLLTYSRLAKAQVESGMKNAQIIEDQIVTNRLRKYYKLIWTWDYETLNLKVEQYSWLLDGKVYILTFTSEQDKFAKFKSIGESILDTFTLKP